MPLALYALTIGAFGIGVTEFVIMGLLLQVSADLGTLNPESVFEIPGSTAVQILSDDGDEKIEGEKCKDLAAEKRRFRSATIALP